MSLLCINNLMYGNLYFCNYIVTTRISLTQRRHNVWKQIYNLRHMGELDTFFDICNNICETRARVSLEGILRNHLLFLVTRSFIDIPLYTLHAEAFTTPRRNNKYVRRYALKSWYEWRSRKYELKFISFYLYLHLFYLLLFTLFFYMFLFRQKYHVQKYFLTPFFTPFLCTNAFIFVRLRVFN